MAFALPPPLRPGDTVAVVAPASPFPRTELWRGLAWLRQRYDVRMRTGALERTGYLAGSDERRTAELARALEDPDVRAIIAARGGYGITRIAPRLPWAAFARSPKWLVGFSDITALHAECAKVGVASVHGPNVTGLGRATPWDRACFMAALERPSHARAWTLEPIVDGSARGVVVGGNVALLVAQAAAGRLLVPEGALVVLEDVTERPYRVDRMLTSLAPHLSRAGGLVFGSFTECDPGPDGVTIEEVLRERARAFGVPAALGAPFGHGARNESFVLGREATIEVGPAGATLTFV
jgi:muramoyltetrapeptide carboxypeptidase